MGPLIDLHLSFTPGKDTTWSPGQVDEVWQTRKIDASLKMIGRAVHNFENI